MARAVAEKSRTIRLSAGVLGKLNTIYEAESRLAGDLHRDPSAGEIAAATGLGVGEVESIKRWSQAPVSIEGPAAEEERRRDDEERRTADVAEPPSGIDELTPRERRVLELRHGIAGGDPIGVAEVARVLDLTPEEVRQLESDGIAKLQRLRA
jgi:RNA polymerase primary sigma factor